MDQKLLARYREYAGSEEALAVLFVKEHLVEAKGHWVDPVDFERYEMSPNNMHFRFVVGGLYARKLQPNYQPKTAFAANGKVDEKAYYLMVRAITWETAHTDIKQQKAAKIRPRRFEVRGVSYDRNRGNTNFFREDAPPEIRALAANLSDRTHPLWDTALQYANAPEFVYEIRKAKVY
jgi:hypothetical protein